MQILLLSLILFQAMQTAIDQQLGKMQTIAGNKRVGLVAFNDMVSTQIDKDA